MTTYGIDDRLKENRAELSKFWQNLTIEKLGLIFGIAALLIVFFGYLNQHMNLWASVGWLTNLFGDFYANVSSELISIVITVLILDRLNARRAKEERKLALFRQAKSRSNDFAKDAIDQILYDDLWSALLDHYRDDKGQIDLSQVQWAGGVQLEKVNLEAANLRGANLQEANLEFINLQKANLGRANLQYSFLRFANLQNTFFGATNLQYADLMRGNLQDADLSGADLRAANLESANLRQAFLLEASLQDANLTRVNMQNANLWKAHLENANLRGANLERANLSDSHLQNTILFEAHLEYANLGFAHLEYSDMKAVNLQNAILSDAYLDNADLRSAQLQNTTLFGTRLEYANLWGANLCDAKHIETAHFNEKTILPDANFIRRNASGTPIFDKYWTPETDMTRYTNPEHPNFWEPEWVKHEREQSNKE